MTMLRRPLFLRATLLWDSVVVAAQQVAASRSLRKSGAAWATPDGSVGERVVVGRATGWDVDATGVSGGVAGIGGQQRNVVGGERFCLAAAGDTALLRYGRLALALSVEVAPPTVPGRLAVDPLLVGGVVFAAVAVLGLLILVFAVTGRPLAPKPTVLLRPDELARTYYVEQGLLTAASSPSPPSDTGPSLGTDRVAASSPVEAALRRDSPPASSHGLSSHRIDSVVLARYREIESCADRTTPSGPNVVALELTIGPNGSVQKIDFSSGELGDDLGQCVGDRIRRFEFPTATDSTTVRLRLRLEP